MNFQEELTQRQKKIEALIDEMLPAEEGIGKNLSAAMNYSMKAGGKRLRPMLIELFCELFRGDPETARPFMAGMEMVHTHSLIHDDLPAMDNDRYRRGKLTTHVVFGEAAAILAGDALLNLAYETVLGTVSEWSDPVLKERGLRALRVLSDAVGSRGMIGGQAVDVENDGKKITRDILDYIYQHKTGDLITASMRIGAVLGGAGPEEEKKVCRIGSCIGLAFQIRDDMLDVTGDFAVLGKETGSDEKNQKMTYATLYSLEECEQLVRKLTDEALDILGTFREKGYENHFLEELLKELVTRKA